MRSLREIGQIAFGIVRGVLTQDTLMPPSFSGLPEKPIAKPTATPSVSRPIDLSGATGGVKPEDWSAADQQRLASGGKPTGNHN